MDSTEQTPDLSIILPALNEAASLDQLLPTLREAFPEAEVVVCRITANGRSGVGECVPYTRYGETALFDYQPSGAFSRNDAFAPGETLERDAAALTTLIFGFLTRLL